MTSGSYLIIVTRGHRDDMRVLKWAVTTDARYIAMIGSKRKTISVVHELEKEGFARGMFGKVFAPMGLEIGAQTPEEIAIAVVAGDDRDEAGAGWGLARAFQIDFRQREITGAP